MIISKYKKSSSLEELLMHVVEATLSITVIMGHQRDMTCYHTLIISATPSALFLPWRKIHCPSSKIRKQSSCVKVKHWETITNRLCSAALVWSACFMKSWDLQHFEKQCCKADGERMVEGAEHGVSWLGKGGFRVWSAEWAVPWLTSFSSVAQSYPTLWDPMNRSMPGLPVHHQLPESTQTHVHCVGNAIQPSHLLLSPSPSALNLSQHQGLFKWVSSSHQMAKVLDFQASTTGPPMNTQDWSPLGYTGWISLQSKGLSRVFSNATVQKHQSFSAQLSL